MTNFFRPAFDFVGQIWFAIDAGNAVRHGKPVSEKARRYCMTERPLEVRAVA